MTTYADAATSIRSTTRRHRLLHPATLLALGLSATVSLSTWTVFNQPQAAPDYTGRIAGLGFSPFQRGQTPEHNQFPSAAEISHDLAQVATLTDRIRVYTVEGPMAQIPALAAPYHLKVTLASRPQTKRKSSASSPPPTRTPTWTMFWSATRRCCTRASAPPSSPAI
jgi:hypothetical protein